LKPGATNPLGGCQRKSAAIFACLVAALLQTSNAQGPGTSFPSGPVNVLAYGAQADAQTSGKSNCSISATAAALTCTVGVFTEADIGKSIEVPGAGASGISPAPNSTLLAKILSISTPLNTNLDTNTGKFRNVTLDTNATTSVSGALVTWGTDNSVPFQAAVNACPTASNGIPSTTALNNANPIFPFTSKGCVIVVPNPGMAGTGDYMFGFANSPGVAVSMPTQVSFQIIGMGNSSKWENSQEAGVRFITAMPITILSIGQVQSSQSGPPQSGNGGSFQLENISFVDTSNNGSAIGGLLMNVVSEAVIAYSSFENFNGQQAGLASNTTALSYGMKATAYGCVGNSGCSPLFNNNIVLLHVKGKNNSIFYDASQGQQDGPIVIGGDIFPTNTLSPLPANPPWSAFAGCLGIISSGGIRLYGTHFDIGKSTADGSACIGILTLSAGIISGKFESTPGGGTGVMLGGGGTAANITIPVGGCSKTANAAVTCNTNTNHGFSAGQVVNVNLTNTTDQPNFNGNFLITSVPSSTSFTYDYPGSAVIGSAGSGTVVPKISFSVKVEGIFNALTKEVIVNSGASNNTIHVMSSNVVTSHVTDNGTNDIVQVSYAGTGLSGGTAGFNNATVNLGPATGIADVIAVSDSVSNSGTGHLLSVLASSGSAAKPVEFAANGNGVEMSTAGVLAPIGSGGITATAMPVSGLTGATASDSISNGNFPLTWNWAQITNSQSGITFGESSPATNGTLGNQFNVEISGMSSSTAVPLGVFGSLSGSQTLPALYVAPTWNTTGVVDAGILENVTNTASGVASLLADLQVGGTSEWKVDKVGNVTHSGKEIAFRYTTHTASALVAGDFALGAGWGTTGTLVVNQGTDQAFNIKITPGGTGIAASPTVTLTFHNGTWTQVPVFVCTQTGGTGLVAPITFTNGVATATTLPMIWNAGGAAPVSGNTYIISCVGMGT